MGDPTNQASGFSGALSTWFHKYRLTPPQESFKWVHEELRRITDYLWELTDKLTDEFSPTVLAAGVSESILSGTVIMSTLDTLDTVKIYVGMVPVSDAVPKAMVHVTHLSGGGFTIRFTRLAGGH